MPWYDDRGECKKNCSFVSGEASTGFWMVAPASVLPPPRARAGDRRRFRLRRRREPAADGLRRPLPVRRAARRPGDADHHRDRPHADLAARRRPVRPDAGRRGGQTAAEVVEAALARRKVGAPPRRRRTRGAVTLARDHAGCARRSRVYKSARRWQRGRQSRSARHGRACPGHPRGSAAAVGGRGRTVGRRVRNASARRRSCPLPTNADEPAAWMAGT